MAKNTSTNTKSNAAAAAPTPIASTVAAAPKSATAQAEAPQASASKADANQAEGTVEKQVQLAVAQVAVQARQADPDAKRSYLVGSVPINHDGRLYGVGYKIQLTESEADRLSGLVIPFPERG